MQIETIWWNVKTYFLKKKKKKKMSLTDFFA